MRSIAEVAAVVLTGEERAGLERLTHATKTEFRLRRRAQIVLLSAAGLAARSTGGEAGRATGTASKRRIRHVGRRLAGLDETGDRGDDPKYTETAGRRIPASLDQPVAAGRARWSGPPIARRPGGVGVRHVWRFSCAPARSILPRARAGRESGDPDFAAGPLHEAARDRSAPAGGGKPSIEAPDRAQGCLKMSNVRALTGQPHDCKGMA